MLTTSVVTPFLGSEIYTTVGTGIGDNVVFLMGGFQRGTNYWCGWKRLTRYGSPVHMGVGHWFSCISIRQGCTLG